MDPDEILDNLRGITCCPAWDGGTLVRSAPDGAALALSRHLKGHATPTTPPEASTEPLALFPGDAQPKTETNGGNGNGNGNGNGQPTIKASINMSLCPDCSVGNLVFQEGCARCMDCGYTKCE